MDNPDFNSSNKCNRRKKEIYDKMGLQRAPFCDYDILKDINAKDKFHTALTQDVSRVIEMCATCINEPCVASCPVQFSKAAETSETLRFKDSRDGTLFGSGRPTQTALENTRATIPEIIFHRKKTSIHLRYLNSLEKIRGRNQYKFQLINQWKIDRNNLKPKPKDYSHVPLIKCKSCPVNAGSKKHYHLRSVTLGAAYLIPWASKRNSREPITHVQEYKYKKTPPLRLKTSVWNKKKQKLERKGFQLEYKERAKQTRLKNLPHPPQPCDHQLPPEYLPLEPLPSPPYIIRRIADRSRLPTSHSVKLPMPDRPITRGYKPLKPLPPLPTRIAQPEIKSTKPAVKTLLPNPLHSGLHKVIIQITEPVTAMKLGTRHGKVTIIDSDDFCESCGSLPCMKLRFCTKAFTAKPDCDKPHINKLQALEILLGVDRVYRVGNKAKRVRRNHYNGIALDIPTELVCRGKGACAACRNDAYFSIAPERHHQSLIDRCRIERRSTDGTKQNK